MRRQAPSLRTGIVPLKQADTDSTHGTGHDWHGTRLAAAVHDDITPRLRDFVAALDIGIAELPLQSIFLKM
jgi:hypothetical protein